MNKSFLLIPFMALLATSCGGGHITTTPVVNTPKTGILNAPKRNALQDDTQPAYEDFYITLGETGWYGLHDVIPNKIEWGANKPYFSFQKDKTLNKYYIYLTWAGYYAQSIPTYVQNIDVDNYTHEGAYYDPSYNSGLGRYVFNSLSLPAHFSGTFYYKPYTTAYEEGHDIGYETGYNDGKADEHQTAYEEGFKEGIIEGQVQAGNNNAVVLDGVYASLFWLPSHATATAFCKKYESYDLLPQVILEFQPVNIAGIGITNQNNANAKSVVLTFSQDFDYHQNIDVRWKENANYTRDVGNLNREQIAEGDYTTASYIKTWKFDTFTYEWQSGDIKDYHYFGNRPYQQVFNPGGMFNTMMKLVRIQNAPTWETEGTPLPQSLYDMYTQDLLRSLIGGTGYSYAQGFQDGTKKEIEASATYNNIFTIFTPAFSAVASFLDMQIGPFKVWYFFMIPLIVTLLILVLRLVKH